MTGAYIQQQYNHVHVNDVPDFSKSTRWQKNKNLPVSFLFAKNIMSDNVFLQIQTVYKCKKNVHQDYEQTD